jgi:hypothetical protein
MGRPAARGFVDLTWPRYTWLLRRPKRLQWAPVKGKTSYAVRIRRIDEERGGFVPLWTKKDIKCGEVGGKGDKRTISYPKRCSVDIPVKVALAPGARLFWHVKPEGQSRYYPIAGVPFVIADNKKRTAMEKKLKRQGDGLLAPFRRGVLLMENGFHAAAVREFAKAKGRVPSQMWKNIVAHEHCVMCSPWRANAIAGAKICRCDDNAPREAD